MLSLAFPKDDKYELFLINLQCWTLVHPVWCDYAEKPVRFSESHTTALGSGFRTTWLRRVNTDLEGLGEKRLAAWFEMFWDYSESQRLRKRFICTMAETEKARGSAVMSGHEIKDTTVLAIPIKFLQFLKLLELEPYCYTPSHCIIYLQSRILTTYWNNTMESRLVFALPQLKTLKVQYFKLADANLIKPTRWDDTCMSTF